MTSVVAYDSTLRRPETAGMQTALHTPRLSAEVRASAVILFVGTTPQDEDDVALELNRQGFQVVAESVNRGLRGTGVNLPVNSDEPLVKRLLTLVGRRLRSPWHVTALTVGEVKFEPPGGSRVDAPVSVGPITIDFGRRETLVEGREVALSKSEFGLLYSLAAQTGRVLTRGEILTHSKGGDYPVTERSIDVHVASIRRKLGSARHHLQTVRGVGYRLIAAPRASDSMQA
jgi:DNA-binding winged helix-turn-helix (wHTH) protein